MDLRDVWAVTEDRAWAVGSGSTFLVWDGLSWADGGFPTQTSYWDDLSLLSIWSDDVVLYVLPSAIPTPGTLTEAVIRYEIGHPGSWTAESVPEEIEYGRALRGTVDGVWMVGGEEVFGLRTDDGWSIVEQGPDVLNPGPNHDDGWNDIFVLDNGDAWAIGRGTSGDVAAITWDGSTWEQCDPVAMVKVGTPNAIWSSEDRTVIVSGEGMIANIECDDGTIEYRPEPYTYPALNDIWGATDEALWAVGRYGTIIGSAE